MDTLKPNELEGLGEWKVVPAAIRRSYRTGSFSAGLDFAARIGPVADDMNHHPDLEITYPSVTVTLTTHDAGGLTELDIDLAGRIDRIASDMGVESAAG